MESLDSSALNCGRESRSPRPSGFFTAQTDSVDTVSKEKNSAAKLAQLDLTASSLDAARSKKQNPLRSPSSPTEEGCFLRQARQKRYFYFAEKGFISTNGCRIPLDKRINMAYMLVGSEIYSYSPWIKDPAQRNFHRHCAPPA